MNFLAHAYLSFNHPGILVGNMISDFVKGKKKYDYPHDVLGGINLHRAIDAYTDMHPATKEAKTFLASAAGPYAGAFVDVVYDYFLANDKTQFKAGQLAQTAQNTYTTLQQHEAILPHPFSLMLPYMVQHDWLGNYKTKIGIAKSFNGVAHRAKYLESSTAIYQLFEQHCSSLQECYNVFFPDVKLFAHQQFQAILDTPPPIFVLNTGTL